MFCEDDRSIPGRRVPGLQGRERRDRLSTAQLIRAIGDGLGKPARLFWLPVSVLGFVPRLLGKGSEVNRLVGPLEVQAGRPLPFSLGILLSAPEMLSPERTWNGSNRPEINLMLEFL